MKTVQVMWRLFPVLLCLAFLFASGCRTRETPRPAHSPVFGSRDILPPPFASPESARPRITTEPPVAILPGQVEPLSPVIAPADDSFVAPSTTLVPPAPVSGIDSLLVPATVDDAPPAVASPGTPPSPAKPEVRSAPPAPPATSAQRTYVVQSGDSLSVIAHRYGINWPTLAALNSMDGKTILHPGMVLLLPDNALASPNPRTVTATAAAGKPSAKRGATTASTTTATSKIARQQRPADGVYKVRPNDSLWVIARRFGCTTNELRALNNLTSDMLRVGQELKIPEVGEASPTTAEKTDSAEAKKPAATASEQTAPTAPAGTPKPVILEPQGPALPGADGVTTPPAGVTPTPPVLNPNANLLIQQPLPIPAVPAAAAANAPGTVAEAPKQMTHTLAPEESLQDLADMYSIGIPEILRLNPGVNNDADLKKRTQVIIPIPAK